MSASAGRVLLIHKGDYDSSATYNPMDEVLYEGSTYVCKQTSTGNLPTNTTYWQLMAQKGADGSSGQGIPTGGTTGQVLTKHSSTDYDVEWSDVELDALSIDEAQKYELIPGKNKAYFDPYVGTIDGITSRINNLAQCQIILNGTATATHNIGISNPVIIDAPLPKGNVYLKAGTYVLSCPQSSVLSDYLFIWIQDRYGNLNEMLEEDSVLTFTINQDLDDVSIGVCVSNGQQLTNQTLQVMVCTQEEWNVSHTYEPYYVPVKDSMFKRSEQMVLGAKNINTYPYSETTQTEADITFTVTDDGIVDIDGTSSGSTQFDFHRTGEFNNLKVGERYILSGAPDIEYLTEDVGLRLVIANDINTSQRQNIDCPQGGEIEFTIPTGWHFHWFTYRIASGKTFSHAKVKPMIRLASDPDDTYVPYAMTNRKLTEAVTVEVLQCSDFMSGVTVNRNSVRKMGELVILDMDLTIPSASSGDLLCVLPSTCKPWDNLILTGVNRSNNTFACFTVKSNGQISTRTVITNSDLAMHAVYTTN